MQWILLIVTVVHVLPAVFWAGSTFVLTRAGRVGADRLAFPQLVFCIAAPSPGPSRSWRSARYAP